MRAPHPTYPLVIELPEPGNYPSIVRAHYVPNSDPPAYRLDAIGMDLPIDVVIPDELAAAGWYWHGSTLVWREANFEYGIHTFVCPPPGWSYAPRGNCFDAARAANPRGWMGRGRSEPKAKPKQSQPSNQVRPVQLAMEL